MSQTKTIAITSLSPRLSGATSDQPDLRSERRALVRPTLIAAMAIVVAGLVVTGALVVGNHLVAAWWLESHQGIVTWDINETNWLQGGVTSVSFSPVRFAFSKMGESDLVHLHRLHRVVRLELAECEGVTSKTVGALRGLYFLADLNLDRLDRYRSDRLFLTSTPLTDACIVHLRALPRLEALSLAGNLITDQGLSQLAGARGLKRLDLSATEVSDAGLVHLIAMKSLETVNLAGTRTTEEGLAQLQLARPDLTIELDLQPDVANGVEQVRGATK